VELPSPGGWAIGAAADVGFAWVPASASSYGVVDNDRQILQYRQWWRSSLLSQRPPHKLYRLNLADIQMV
jgi:hypothetical protein